MHRAGRPDRRTEIGVSKTIGAEIAPAACFRPLDPIDFMFSFCSHERGERKRAMGSPDMNAAARSSESEAEVAASLEAEIDEAIATCGGDVRAALRATLIANAYLETELERLTEAISTGFARGRMRKPAHRVKIRV
jgi:hypothetical protein